MDAERWRKIDELFRVISRAEPEQRGALLAELSAGDEGLRREVEALLDASEAAGGFLETNVFEAAAPLLSGEAHELKPGQIFGRYHVIERVGAGGMGEVYSAEDTTLDRRVALKLLPSSLAARPDYVRRFRREARAASRLNHPNILIVHEVGEWEGRHFIATEFVEGSTLRAALGAGPLPLSRALDIAAQVADAISAAHEAGIVHRDIKPENVMIRADGYVKVLDFGIAKLVERRRCGGEAPSGATVTTMTGRGIAIGTAHYMSPEQARGREVDARTDVWSLGVVLHEMLTGRAPFDGESAADVVAAVLHQEPEPLACGEAEVERIVGRALRKDAGDRYQTAIELLSDLRRSKEELKGKPELAAARVTGGGGGAPGDATGGTRTDAATGGASGQTADGGLAARTTSNAEHILGGLLRHKGAALSALLLLATLSAAVGFALYKFLPGRSPAATTGPPPWPFAEMKLTRLTSNGRSGAAAVSPDGRFAVYTTLEVGFQRQTLWLRQLATNTDTQLIPPAEVVYFHLAFTRDGHYIFYSARPKGEPISLYRMPALGGPVQKVWPGFGRRFALSPDARRLAYLSESGGMSTITVANVDGTGERVLATRSLPDWFGMYGLDWSPDGRTIACGAGTTEGGVRMTLMAFDADDGTGRQVGARSWAAVYRVAWLGDGSGLVMSVDDHATHFFPQLWYIAYPSGEARRITHDLNTYSEYSLSVSADASQIASIKSDLTCNIWIAPGDDPARARQITFGSVGKYDGFQSLSWTPDGRLVYGAFVDNNGAVYVMDAEGKESKQLTEGTYQESHTSADPLGRYVFFQSNRTGRFHIWRVGLDGAGLKELTDGADDQHPSVTPDGRHVIFSSNREGEYMLYKVSVDGGEAVRLSESRQAADFPEVSPDGRLVAFVHYDPKAGGRRLSIASAEGGPVLNSFDARGRWGPVRWTPDGRAVTYPVTSAGVSNLWAQPIDGGPARRLTDFKSDTIYNFAWSRDGRRLAIARGNDPSDAVLISSSR